MEQLQNRKKESGKLAAMILILLVVFLSACSSQSSNGTQSGGGSNTAEKNVENSTGNTGNTGNTESTIEQVTISTITGWPVNDPTCIGYELFVDKVTEKSGGAIEFDYKGGPESIPAFEQAEAVKNGVVDFACNATSYYYDQMPESAAYTYSEISAEEERANGAYDLFNEINHKKMNVHIIGRGTNPGPVIYSKVPLDSLEDLKGFRIRSSPAYLPVINSLGADVVTMPGGEIYTALERGIIDGFAWPALGAVGMGWHEQIKYKYYPEFAKSDVVYIMNLDKWNSLSEEVQSILTEALVEVEQELPVIYQGLYEEEEKTLKENGVEVLKFAETEALLKIAADAGWEWIRENAPEYADQLEEKFRK